MLPGQNAEKVKQWMEEPLWLALAFEPEEKKEHMRAFKLYLIVSLQRPLLT